MPIFNRSILLPSAILRGRATAELRTCDVCLGWSLHTVGRCERCSPLRCFYRPFSQTCVAVARCIAIRYVLLVLWLRSRCNIMGSMAFLCVFLSGTVADTARRTI